MDNREPRHVGSLFAVEKDRRSTLYEIARHPKVGENEKIQNSPIAERFCRWVLDSSPGVCKTARYVYVETVQEVSDLLEEASKDFHAPDFVVFPEVWIGQYRADYIIAARSIKCQSIHCNNNCDDACQCRRCVKLIVELDGSAWHSSQEKISMDLVREKEIRNRTKFPILRFSGAEILYSLECVDFVLETYIEILVDHVIYSSSNESELRNKVIELIHKITILPALREQYVSAHGKQQIDRLREVYSKFRSESAEFFDDED
jgi:hypothetical protein